jgi:transcription antitermination factor NusG
MDNSLWNVLHVVSNHEKHVARHLAVRSVEHYLPLYKERVRWTDRTVVAERPLFSGYVFVRLAPQTRRFLLTTPGVLRVLGDGTNAMVSCEELDRIREGLAKGMSLRPHPCVTVGTRVRVREGVFAGTEGAVTELRHQCNVVIGLTAVNQFFSLEVRIHDLEVLNQPDPAAALKPARRCGS